jgi:hypothetical protein
MSANHIKRQCVGESLPITNIKRLHGTHHATTELGARHTPYPLSLLLIRARFQVRIRDGVLTLDPRRSFARVGIFQPL